MNMTDMLLQMTLQSAWQLPELAVSSGQNPNSGSQGPRFQDLLEQRQKDWNSTQNEQPKGEAPDTVTDSAAPTKQEQPQAAVPSAEQALAGAVLLVEVPTVVEQPVVLPEQMAAPINGVEDMAVGAQMQTAQGMQQTAPLPQAEVTSPVLTPEGEGQPVQEAVQTPVQTVGQPQAEPQQEQTASQNSQTERPVQATATHAQTQEPELTAAEGWQTPLFQNVEHTPIRVGDAPVDMTAPPEEVNTALGDALKGAVDLGAQRLEIRLSPENLGTVVAEFTRSPEGALHVVLHAETQQAAKLLSDHAPALSLLLQENTNSQVRVDVPQPQQSQSPWQQPDQGAGQQHQQQQQPQQNTQRQDAESFLHQLRLGLIEMEQEAV